MKESVGRKKRENKMETDLVQQLIFRPFHNICTRLEILDIEANKLLGYYVLLQWNIAKLWNKL